MRRTCPICYKPHDTILENTETGERIEEYDLCKRCLLDSSFNLVEQLQQVTIEAHDPKEQHIADHMTALVTSFMKSTWLTDELGDR